jgi:hypothetical protein
VGIAGLASGGRAAAPQNGDAKISASEIGKEDIKWGDEDFADRIVSEIRP